MKTVTIRRSTHVDSPNNYIICSESGIIDYYGRVNCKQAEGIRDKVNSILKIVPRIEIQQIVDLVVCDIALEKELG